MLDYIQKQKQLQKYNHLPPTKLHNSPYKPQSKKYEREA